MRCAMLGCAMLGLFALVHFPAPAVSQNSECAPILGRCRGTYREGPPRALPQDPECAPCAPSSHRARKPASRMRCCCAPCPRAHHEVDDRSRRAAGIPTPARLPASICPARCSAPASAPALAAAAAFSSGTAAAAASARGRSRPARRGARTPAPRPRLPSAARQRTARHPAGCSQGSTVAAASSCRRISRCHCPWSPRVGACDTNNRYADLLLHQSLCVVRMSPPPPHRRRRLVPSDSVERCTTRRRGVESCAAAVAHGPQLAPSLPAIR